MFFILLTFLTFLKNVVFLYFHKKFVTRPLAVSFEVYDDFFNYKTGIYHHTFLRDEKNFEFNPFELTNHAGKLILKEYYFKIIFNIIFNTLSVVGWLWS